jgi:hypothetical protein
MLNRYLKNIGLKGHQIISLPGVPTCVCLVLYMLKYDTKMQNIFEFQDHLFPIFFTEFSVVSII